MSKAKQRHKNKPRQTKINAAEPEYNLLRNMAAKSTAGTKMIELAPPGIQFRALTNVDHITQISFANKIEDFKVYDEEHVDGFVVSESEPLTKRRPAKSHMEPRVTGFQVIVCVGGQQNDFSFSKLEVAIAYYNDLIEQLDAVGIPMALRARIFAPPPESAESEKTAGLVDADGDEIEFEKIDLDPAEDLEPEQKPN